MTLPVPRPNLSRVSVLCACSLLAVGLMSPCLGQGATATSKVPDSLIEVDAALPSAQFVVTANSLVAFKIKNLIPLDPMPYSLGLIDRVKVEPPLDLGPLLKASAAGGADPCLQSIIPGVKSKLAGAKSEVEVKALVSKLSENLKAANDAELARTGAGCTDQQLKTAAKELEDSTTYLFPGTYVVGSSRELVFSVTKAKAPVAEVTVSAPVDTVWLPSYGVTFLRSRDVESFAKAAEAPATGFIVTREADRESFNYMPSIFFTRKSSGERQQRWCNGCVIAPTFGLGTDLTNVSAMFGLGARWGDNITITAGVALAKEKRLHGKYNFGDSIAESLSEDQLTESTWGSTAFIGITIRSLTNPFKPAEKPAAPAKPE